MFLILVPIFSFSSGLNTLFFSFSPSFVCSISYPAKKIYVNILDFFWVIV
nr:MAG TPA: hypothetical protein [Caudoviricetes sp.]